MVDCLEKYCDTRHAAQVESEKITGGMDAWGLYRLSATSTDGLFLKNYPCNLTRGIRSPIEIYRPTYISGWRGSLER